MLSKERNMNNPVQAQLGADDKSSRFARGSYVFQGKGSAPRERKRRFI